MADAEESKAICGVRKRTQQSSGPAELDLADLEHHSLASGKDFRTSHRRDALVRHRFNHTLGLSAGFRNPPERVVAPEDHVAVVTPGGRFIAHLADRVDLQASERDLLDAPVGIEPDPFSVGREERLFGSLGSGERSGFELVDIAYIELPLVSIIGEVNDGITVA